MNPEIKEFMTGTVFVAGAAKIEATGPGAVAPPIFMVLLKKDAYQRHPELLTLFRMLKNKGTVALHNGIDAGMQWGVIEDPEKDARLARLDLTFRTPVNAKMSFLFLADNYKQIWVLPAREEYLLGLAMEEEVQKLPPTASFADAMHLCVLMKPPVGSRALQQLVDHYAVVTQAWAPPVFIDAAQGDDMQYWCMTLDTSFGPRPLLCMTVAGVSTFGGGGNVQADIYAGRGLHIGKNLSEAEGWSWAEEGPEFVVRDGDGGAFASFTPALLDRAWVAAVRSGGTVVVAVGDDLVQRTIGATKKRYTQGLDDGTVAAGIVNAAPGPERPEPAPSPEPAQRERRWRSWWRRFTGEVE